MNVQTASRLSGKQLAKHVARTNRARSIAKIVDWQTYDARCAAVAARGRAPGAWESMELLAARTDLRINDLLTRIAALEAELAQLRGEPEARATAKSAPEPKPLRINFMRAIDSATAASVIKKIENAHGRPIVLSLCSPGGSIAEARKIADAAVSHGNVEVRAFHEVDSAAVLIFASGRVRHALKDTTYHFHAPTMSGTAAKTAADQMRLEREADSIAAFLGKQCQKPAAMFRGMMTKRGCTIDNNRASELGLLNGVVRRTHTPKARNK